MNDASQTTEMKLLIVDDERAVREIMAEYLDAVGYSVVQADSVESAFAAVQREHPTLVLTDIEMPGQTGFDLLQLIRKHDPDLDVIMVSGVVDTQTAIQSIRQGAADYVTKPFNLEEVQIVIERTLEKRHLILENRAHQEQLEELVAERTRQLVESNRQVEGLYADLQDSYESTLQALITALDYRDNETQGHSYRVVEYATLVAGRLDVEGEQLTWIRRGAILHDVGKIGIPDSVLRKPGPLDATEWEVMKKHPEMGFQMLENIRFLEPALDIVHCHQERFDGTGYPRGMRGDDIPLGARIFAVVDTFDAMTSDRPYRKAMTVNEAREEIESCSGTQFDPVTVKAFLSIEAVHWHEIRDRVHKMVMDMDRPVKPA
jgi:putative nucleotidyltransferase with HDIG domain